MKITPTKIIYSREITHGQCHTFKSNIPIDKQQRESFVTDANNKHGELNIYLIDNGNFHRNHLNNK